MSKILIYIFALFLLILKLLAEENKNIFNFNQTDFDFDFERVELARFNKEYMTVFKARTFKYNRTTPLVNMTTVYNVDAGNEVEIVIQAYKFASNEYRTFPLRFEVNLCDALKNNLIGCGTLLKCGNFTGCPIVKGVRAYYCNWGPDSSQFPSYLPNGHYMVELQGMYHSTELWVLRFYGIVSRPIPKP